MENPQPKSTDHIFQTGFTIGFHWFPCCEFHEKTLYGLKIYEVPEAQLRSSSSTRVLSLGRERQGDRVDACSFKRDRVDGRGRPVDDLMVERLIIL